MSDQSRCRIWGTRARVECPKGDYEIVDSPRAGGRYLIYGRASSILEHHDERLKARITSWLIEQRRLGAELPRVNSVTIRDAEQNKSLSVEQRADNLLRYIKENTLQIGSVVAVFARKASKNKMQMQALAWSESTKDSELIYLLNYLTRMDWVERDGNGYRLTVEGYNRLAELEQRVSESSRAFVAMWFDDSMTEVWEDGIRPAIREAGYEAIRVDQKEHVNKICDEIVAEIRRSRFLVADFTHGGKGPRGGVYYEAGFAHGLGIRVIFTCRDDAMDKVHFDTRQYNHIIWKTPKELCDKLTTRIACSYWRWAV